MIRLSICIPTLNRAAFIGATLDSIISQATDEVEIVVVDGASTDNTEEVVYRYQQKFPRLGYLRLQAKGGVDQDYCRAVEMARGEYCWLMSDDDILKPGAIQNVLERLHQDYGLLVVNTEARTVDLARVLDKQKLPLVADRVYTPSEQETFFIDAASHLSFAPSVIIKRGLWMSRNKEEYYGTLFVHVGIIFQQPLTQPILVVAEPLIAVRQGNALWSLRAFEIWMFKWPRLMWSFEQFSDTAKKRVIPKEPWRDLRQLLRYAGTGYYSVAQYQRWIKPSATSRTYKLAAWLIASAPKCIMGTLAFAYLRFFYRRSRIALYELTISPFFRRCFRRGSASVF